MKEITLAKYVEANTQKDAADFLGCTAGAVWQMLRNKRDVRLVLDKKGQLASWYEIKRARRSKAA